MEEIALGEMQMTETEFWHITPRAFFNKLAGFRKQEQDKWEQVRFVMWSNLVPYSPKGKPTLVQDVLPFPWDNELKVIANESAAEKRKKADKKWAEIDALKKRNKQNP